MTNEGTGRLAEALTTNSTLITLDLRVNQVSYNLVGQHCNATPLLPL